MLDRTDAAIRHARQRVGDQIKQVKWIVTDILNFEPEEKYDFWHDRTTFNILTHDDEIKKYKELVCQAIKPKGHMVIGTFSDIGPQHCGGLEVHQYSEDLMETQFSSDFKKVECKRIDHITPYNTVQNFLFCLFKRNAK